MADGEALKTALGFDGLCGPHTAVGAPALFNHPENGKPEQVEAAFAAGLRLGQIYRVWAVNDQGFVTYLALVDHDGWFNSCLFSEFPD